MRVTKDVVDFNRFAKLMQGLFPDLVNNSAAASTISDIFNIMDRKSFSTIKDKSDIYDEIKQGYLNGEFDELKETRKTYGHLKNLLEKAKFQKIWDGIPGNTAEEKTYMFKEMLDEETRNATNGERQEFFEESTDKPDPNDPNAKPKQTQNQLPPPNMAKKIANQVEKNLDAAGSASGLFGGQLGIKKRDYNEFNKTIQKLKKKAKFFQSFHATIQLINSKNFKTPTKTEEKSYVPTEDISVVQGTNPIKMISSHKMLPDDLQLYKSIKNQTLEKNFVDDNKHIDKLKILVDCSYSMQEIFDEVLGVAYAFAKVHADAGLNSKIAMFNTAVLEEFDVSDFEAFLDLSPDGGTDINAVLDDEFIDAKNNTEFLLITDAEDEERKDIFDGLEKKKSQKDLKLHTIVINNEVWLKRLSKLSDSYFEAENVDQLRLQALDKLNQRVY